MSKANKIEHEQHLDECVEFIMGNLAGWTTFTSWAREKYDINNKQANTMWKSAWEVISEQLETDRGKRRQYYLQELERLKDEAENDGKWADAIKAITLQQKLEGLEVNRVEVEGNITFNVDFSDKTSF